MSAFGINFVDLMILMFVEIISDDFNNTSTGNEKVNDLAILECFYERCTNFSDVWRGGYVAARKLEGRGQPPTVKIEEGMSNNLRSLIIKHNDCRPPTPVDNA